MAKQILKSISLLLTVVLLCSTVASYYKPIYQPIRYSKDSVPRATIKIVEGHLTIQYFWPLSGMVSLGAIKDRNSVKGFRFFSMNIPYPTSVGFMARYWHLEMPMWFVILGFAVMPFITYCFVPIRRWLRRQKGLCVYCGYDLRESPVRCPECGKTNTLAKGEDQDSLTP